MSRKNPIFSENFFSKEYFGNCAYLKNQTYNFIFSKSESNFSQIIQGPFRQLECHQVED